jgi:hypothetical protein
VSALTLMSDLAADTGLVCLVDNAHGRRTVGRARPCRAPRQR